MSSDIKKFEELMRTDSETQVKLLMAAGNYKGEPNDRNAFVREVILPVAREMGLSAEEEELDDYLDFIVDLIYNKNKE